MLWCNRKGVFFRVENFVNFALLMNKIRSPDSYRYTRKLLCLFCRRKFCKKTLYSGFEVICEFSQTMLYHNQNLFLIVSCCFCSFLEFAKVLEKQVWRVRVAHLHSVARALSSPTRCFQIVNKSVLTKICFVVFCAEMLQKFSPTFLPASCVFLWHCETLLRK